MKLRRILAAAGAAVLLCSTGCAQTAGTAGTSASAVQTEEETAAETAPETSAETEAAAETASETSAETETAGRQETEEASGETDSAPMSEQELYDAAVLDAMTIEEDELLPVVSLEEGADYAVYDADGRVLLLTYHKYPESYPAGADVTIGWGEVWTFTGGEMEAFYQAEKEETEDWEPRLKQVLGLYPENASEYVTAMWVYPEDVVRPAYVQEIGDVEMTDHFSEDVDEEFKEWFDGNIIWSYFDSAYPWTRLGYTYDWAAGADEYGLSEFLVRDAAQVKVAYTVTREEFLDMLEDGTWRPVEPSEQLPNAA